MSNFKNLVGCMLVLAIVASQAHAEIVTPTVESFSSEFAAAENTVNGSGLSGVGNVEDQLHDNNENNMWQTGNFGTGTSIGETIVFDLQGSYDLSNAIIWQYNGINGVGLPELDREVEDLDVAVSPNLVDPFVSVGTVTLAPALDQTAAGFNEPAQTFALAGASDVRRVQFTILSVQGGVDDAFAGLSEVRFEGRQIPEPASIGLAAGGIISLSLGFLRRRKNRT